MPNNASKLACILYLLFFSVNAFPQSSQNDREIAVVELGGAVSQSLTGGGASFGPDLAIEATPIEDRLELEAGVTPLFGPHSRELDVDFLFKKPWTLSGKAEFMVGIGPEWIHTSENSVKANSIGAEGILDFMYWPSKKHKFGWFLEPGYDYSFGRGHEQSLGISGGLLIAIR